MSSVYLTVSLPTSTGGIRSLEAYTCGGYNCNSCLVRFRCWTICTDIDMLPISYSEWCEIKGWLDWVPRKINLTKMVAYDIIKKDGKEMENIVGQKIVKIRPMTNEEKKNEGWHRGSTVVIELSNGVLLYPSSDEEGNDAGVMFGKDGKRSFILV